MRAWGAFIVLAFILCAGCASAPTSLDPLTQSQVDRETEHYLQVRVVNAVKRWYGSQDVRVVVESRSPARWRLRVGPEMTETTVEIDTTLLEVIRVWPGY